MKNNNKTILIVLLLCLMWCMNEINCEIKLQFVMETFRHGARWPTVGDDQFFDAQAWPDFSTQHGELTAVGMRQHYVLGTALRNLYI